MREVYKNPMLYYLAIPVLVGLWPLLVYFYYLPQAQDSRESEGGLVVQGQTDVIEILRIDPERPNMLGKGQVTMDFSYGSAVDRVANLCKIAASNYDFKAGTGGAIAGGKKRQDGQVKLNNVSIIQAATFLSTIQAMWTSLTCESAHLTKRKGMPDQWEADFRFLYYF